MTKIHFLSKAGLKIIDALSTISSCKEKQVFLS